MTRARQRVSLRSVVNLGLRRLIAHFGSQGGADATHEAPGPAPAVLDDDRFFEAGVSERRSRRQVSGEPGHRRTGWPCRRGVLRPQRLWRDAPVEQAISPISGAPCRPRPARRRPGMAVGQLCGGGIALGAALTAAGHIAGLVHIARAVSGMEAWSRLGEVSMPVKVGCGDLDMAFLVARRAELVGRLPNVRYQVPSGIVHLPQLEQPSKWASRSGRLSAVPEPPRVSLSPGSWRIARHESHPGRNAADNSDRTLRRATRHQHLRTVRSRRRSA